MRYSRRIDIKEHPACPRRGFTLLFAVLAASLLLAVGLAIFNIAFKESILSAAATDSQLSFYAADAGVECTLYWDLQPNPPGSPFSGPANSEITCTGETIRTGTQTQLPTQPPRASKIGGGGLDSIFLLDFSPARDRSGSCALITVDKSAPPFTIIESRGFNTCDTTSPRRVERAIRSVY